MLSKTKKLEKLFLEKPPEDQVRAILDAHSKDDDVLANKLLTLVPSLTYQMTDQRVTNNIWAVNEVGLCFDRYFYLAIALIIPFWDESLSSSEPKTDMEIFLTRDIQVYALYSASLTLAERLEMDMDLLLSSSLTFRNGYFDGYEKPPSQYEEAVSTLSKIFLGEFEKIWEDYRHTIPI